MTIPKLTVDPAILNSMEQDHPISEWLDEHFWPSVRSQLPPIAPGTTTVVVITEAVILDEGHLDVTADFYINITLPAEYEHWADSGAPGDPPSHLLPAADRTFTETITAAPPIELLEHVIVT